MVPYGTVWSCMVPYGPIWSLMVQYGTAWSHMVPYLPTISLVCDGRSWLSSSVGPCAKKLQLGLGLGQATQQNPAPSLYTCASLPFCLCIGAAGLISWLVPQCRTTSHKVNSGVGQKVTKILTFCGFRTPPVAQSCS